MGKDRMGQLSYWGHDYYREYLIKEKSRISGNLEE